MAKLDPQLYTVAWIAPLDIEARAALQMLDHRHHGRFPLERGDDYVFQAGDVRGHNVIIATLPAGQEYGNGSAAALASQVKKFFPNLWFGLLVGVAAGLPKLSGSSIRDIRLGDVLVALPEGESAGLVAYDLGKETTDDGFQLLRGGRVLATTETVIRSAIGSIKLHAPDEVASFLPFYNDIKDKRHSTGNFVDPGQEADLLYETSDSGARKIMARDRRADDVRTQVWYGPIGSGEKLMKNASIRDELRDKYGLIGLEMEAAGMMNRIPVGVIRGVCDYGDEHKNKEWQPYAAAMAAAYAKAILAEIPPRKSGRAGAKENKQRVHHIPFRHNKAFAGREREIKTLFCMLFDQERECVALSGLGGMGKTQIALEIAYRVKATMKQYMVLWIPVHSLAAYEKAVSDVIRKLSIPCSTDDDRKEVLQQYLSSEISGHWLLILDNADDPALFFETRFGSSRTLFELFPRSSSGRILVTTRSSSIAQDVAGSDTLPLGDMTAADARSLLSTALLDKSQLKYKDAVSQLLEKLTYLPLTVAQAAAYMNTNKTPITAYLRLCSLTDGHLIGLLQKALRDETHYSRSQGAVATTWLISFDAIRLSDPVAAKLLAFIQWIEPKSIPLALLPLGGANELQREDAIGLLCQYNFLSRRDDKEIFDMHSLVHLSLRIWNEQCNAASPLAIQSAIAHVNAIFPSSDWSKRLLWQQYLPHCIALFWQPCANDCESSQRLGFRLGQCLYADGRMAQCVTVLEAVVATQSASLPELSLDLLASQHELAVAYLANDQVREAIALLEHVIAIKRKIYTEDHPDILVSQSNLASAYRTNGQVKDAIALLEHVVLMQTTLPVSHTHRLASQVILASAYQANRQIIPAIALLEHVVAVRKTELIEDHPSLLTAQNNLATAYRENNQVKEAIALLEHIVTIHKRTLTEDHPQRLTSEHELALAYTAKGQVKEAICLLEHGLIIRKTRLTEDHPSRLASEHSLGCAYLANGQVKEAITMLENVVLIQKKSLAENHRHRLQSQHQLALVYLTNGRAKEARSLLEYIVAIQKSTLTQDHPDLLSSQGNLASAYLNTDEVKQAILLLEHIVSIQRMTLAKDDLELLAAQSNLASAYLDTGQIEEAIKLLEHIVAIETSLFADDSPDGLASRRCLASAYWINGQVRDAIALLEHGVAIKA